jgi:predicted nuclease of restriction endonuclease-like (RecB) superfamily
VLNSIQNNQEFINFVKTIKDRILLSQYQALKKVNRELIDLYWSIGKDIVSKQKEHGWGKSVVKKLSQELQKEFVGMRGFSAQNLWNMRQFYLEYYQNEKLQPLVGEISWTKNVVIFQKTKDILAREFYIKSVIKFGWTKDLLINHLDSKSYEKFLLNQTTKRLPSNLEKYLPTTDEIEKNLIKFMEGIYEG